MLLSFALLGFLFLVAVPGEVVLFPWTSNDGSFGNAVDAQLGFGNSQPISTECASALNRTVACDPQMQLLAASGYVISLDGASSSLCAASCNSSLVAYRNTVTTACGASGAFDTYPNTWRGDIIYDYFNMVCDKDPNTGEYCPKWLKEQYAANGNPKLEDLPDSALCSHCQINNMRTVQNSIFLGYNGAMVDTYRRIFTRCSVNATTTPKPPPEETFPNTADGANRTCLSGNIYMSQAGDTCHSIALAKSVAEGTLASINDLGANCNRMTLESGTRFNLCLPRTCTTAQAGATDDCWSISSQYNISFVQFKAFNPTINSECTNLRPNGTVVCVSSPDGNYTPGSLPGSNSSWSLGEYADTIVPAPSGTAFGTTTRCGAYYQVQTADTCRRISIAAKVSVDLFQQINPSIDEGCTNLIPGLWYCVHPTVNWNDVPSGGSTPNSTTVAPPSPTPPGTTPECYKWHVVASGDNCDLLRNTLGITMTQLTLWNPDLKADCSNLILGDAYCVQGPSVHATTTAAGTSTITTSKATGTITITTSKAAGTGTTTTSKAPASTPSSPCAKTYTVRSGDWCSKIWEQFGLSESDFRRLNPSLNANCDLSIGQVLCVAAPSTCATTYTVQSGDWCSKIWERFGLTEAKFRALNPSLNANCDINIGQKLCVG